MPKFYLNVKVNEVGPDVEKVLKKFGDIRTKVEAIKLYCLETNVKPQNVDENYNKLKAELSKQPYVVRVEESAELELLNV
jgi:hypothetical protein